MVVQEKLYTAEDLLALPGNNHVLDGAPVLPGFKLPVRDVFAVLDE